MPIRKECNKCEVIKPLSQFHKGNWKYGVRATCKGCRSIENSKNKDKIKNYNLRRYGINIIEYRKLYDIQNGLCKICGIWQPTLHVDHSHVTQKVRGLLCQSCNQGMGFFKDSVEILEEVIKYLNQNADS